MPIDHESKREFERYSVSLKADVELLNDMAASHSEAVVLQDISGGGTRFVTTRPELYSIGDTVDLTIHLPGGDSLNAEIKGVGKVVWMGELDEGETTVGLCMNDLLVFDQFNGESD
ncbi:MAG: PilZ domain-containing protein [Mariprofundaceae bacterium]|nr:PilZ domain-containing protein [Mariprofundaceae bacterium]